MHGEWQTEGSRCDHAGDSGRCQGASPKALFISASHGARCTVGKWLLRHCADGGLARTARAVSAGPRGGCQHPLVTAGWQQTNSTWPASRTGSQEALVPGVTPTSVKGRWSRAPVGCGLQEPRSQAAYVGDPGPSGHVPAPSVLQWEHLCSGTAGQRRGDGASETQAEEGLSPSLERSRAHGPLPWVSQVSRGWLPLCSPS